MREIKFAVKAEQQEKLLKSASFITAEKILFGTNFGNGLLSKETPVIGSDNELEEYIVNKCLEAEGYMYKSLFAKKATTALCMYIMGNQFDSGWGFKAIIESDSILSLSLSSIDEGLLKLFSNNDEEDVEKELELFYDNMLPNVVKVSVTLCNYEPIATAVIEISQILSKENIADDDVKYINNILDGIGDFPYQKFLNALELFNSESIVTEFLDEDEDVNFRWNKVNQ